MYATSADLQTSTPVELYVARQPIFDRDRNLVAYELLFRSGSANVFPANIDPERASKEMIGQTVSVFGLDALVGNQIGYLNVTRRVLLEKTYTCLPPDRIVLELVESLRPESDVLAACQAAKAAGYSIALDDFSGQPELAAFLPLCDVVKVDWRATDDSMRRSIARHHAGSHVRLLAENIESDADFEFAVSLGFTHFQGFFFCRPEMLSRQDIPTSKLVYLQFLSQLNRPTLDFKRIEQLIKQDVSLSVKFLRYLKSAAFGFRGEISTIKQALAMLGERPFRRWASVLAVAALSADRPGELLSTCLVRGRFCELLARELGMGGRELDLFAVGLFSLMDAVVGRPLPELLKDVAMPGDLVEALLPRGKANRIGDTLALVIAYERADWERVDQITKRLDLADSINKLPRCYQDALSWAASTALAG